MDFFDILLNKKLNGGGGGSATLINKNINSNGTYNASSDNADGYSKVVVNVPASAVDTGTKSIESNGTHDVTGYASADVSVPNSYAAGDEGKVVSNGALVSQTAHAEVTQNGTIDTTLNNSVTVNVSGSAISDGIVVKSRDSSGYPTEVDYYNSDGVIYRDTFGNSRENSDYGWIGAKLETINLKGAESFAVGTEAFYGCRHLSAVDFSKITSMPGAASTNNSPNSQFRDCIALTSIDFSNLTGAVAVYAFYQCTALTTVVMPKISELCGYQQARGCFGGCTALTTCQFGSVGYPVTAIQEGAFNGVTQSGLTITVYTTGTYVDTLVTKIHTSATGATVVVKASENTTYGGNSYSAGDTIVTSTPT